MNVTKEKKKVLFKLLSKSQAKVSKGGGRHIIIQCICQGEVTTFSAGQDCNGVPTCN